MAERIGTLLIFTAGTTKEEAHEALQALADRGLIEPETQVDWAAAAASVGRSGPTVRYDAEMSAALKRPEFRRTVPSILHTFDDEYGGPVWYEP